MLLEGRLEVIAVSSPGLRDCGNVVCACTCVIDGGWGGKAECHETRGSVTTMSVFSWLRSALARWGQGKCA